MNNSGNKYPKYGGLVKEEEYSQDVNVAGKRIKKRDFEIMEHQYEFRLAQGIAELSPTEFLIKLNEKLEKEFSRAYAFCDLINDETHYELRRAGHEWVNKPEFADTRGYFRKDGKNFSVMDDSYRVVRNKVLEAFVDSSIDAVKKRKPLRRSLRKWIK